MGTGRSAPGSKVEGFSLMAANDGRQTQGRAARRRARSAAGRRAARQFETLPPLVPLSQVKRGRGAMFLLACGAVLVGGLVAVVAGTPLVGGPFERRMAGVAMLVAVAALAVVVLLSRGVSRKLVIRSGVVGGALVVLFLWGAAGQVVVDGVPHLRTSETARSYRLAEQLLVDLYVMSEFDVLLGHDDATARANLREYDPAADQLEAIAARWATTEIASLPDGRFGPILRHVYTSADFGAQALRAKRTVTLQFDPRTAESVDSYRGTFIRELLTAGPLLSELSSEMGFDLVPDEGGLVG